MRERELAAQRAEDVVFPCSRCGAEVGVPCKGGRLHAQRLAAAGITAPPNKPATPRSRSRSVSGGPIWYLRSGASSWRLGGTDRIIAARLRPEFDAGIEVSLSADALETIRREVQAASGFETGASWSAACGAAVARFFTPPVLARMPFAVRARWFTIRTATWRSSRERHHAARALKAVTRITILPAACFRAMRI
jgi:hypothetical protein